MYKFITTIVFLLFFAGIIAHAQPDEHLTKSIDSLLAPQFEGNQPGISILVAKKGQIVYQHAFGSANIELNTPMRPDMLFRIGSITKQFTAVAILQLVEQGKISLQDSVQQYIKDFPSKGYTITIENLLTNTSGIVDFTAKDDPDPFIERRDFTPVFLMNYFKNEPLLFKPGSKYAYSNSNYVLLGYIVQLVSGENYHRYMAEHVIKPAGLQHTLYTGEQTAVPGRVAGYTWDRDFFDNCDYQTLSLGFACGDLLSTTEDLYKWNTAVLAGKLVKKETLQKAITPYKLMDGTYSTYGYGWFIDTFYGSPCIHHDGQTSGFIAMEKYFPKDDVYAAILTNVKTADDKTNFSDSRFRLFNDIFLLALSRKLQTSAPISDSLMSTYTGVYQLTSAPKRTITVSKENNHLMAHISGQGVTLILFQSDTSFVFEGINDATGEFVIENGKLTKIVVMQKGEFVWKKIK